MKKYIGISVVLFACAVVANAQTAGSGTAATGSTAAPGTVQGNAASPPGTTTTLPPGLEKRDQSPTGLQHRDQLPPGLAKGTNDSASGFAATNHFGTNQFGAGIATNRFAATNDSGVGITPLQGTTTNQFGNTTVNRPRVTPTGPMGTNRIYGTNSGIMRTNNLAPQR